MNTEHPFVEHAGKCPSGVHREPLGAQLQRQQADVTVPKVLGR